MENKLKEAGKLVKEIVKNTGRKDLDYTVQFSTNSVNPDKINYCVQIEAPANGLQPITFVKDSYKDLIESLKKAVKGIDKRAIEIAYYEAEIERGKYKQKFYEEKVKELTEES